MAKAGRLDKPFLIAMSSVVAVACLSIGAWATLVRFNQPFSTYAITTVVALVGGFGLVRFGSRRRALAAAGLAAAFVIFLLLSAVRGEIGVVQYAWLLGVMAGGILARGEFPWGSTVPTRETVGEFSVLSAKGRGAPTAIDSTEAERIVRELDGRGKNVVSFKFNGSRLDVCGAADGAMVVFYNPESREMNGWSQLRSPVVSGKPEEVAVGSHLTQFEARDTVKLDAALTAVEHFAYTGELDPRLEWHSSPRVNDRRILPA